MFDQAPKTKGFTLLELLVVVAIIGLLASVAMGAYQGNVATARAAKMLLHYGNSDRLVKSLFANAQAARALGGTVFFPATANEWLSEINPGDVPAPGGGAAFVTGTGNAQTGAVGVVYTGSFAGNDAQVVLYRPTYSGLTAASTTISMQCDGLMRVGLRFCHERFGSLHCEFPPVNYPALKSGLPGQTPIPP